ncbi:MAG: esterase [Winogradskyella sp.]|nr:esterase [Winogradskyella sp.]
MRTMLLVLLSLFVVAQSFSQTTYKEIKSSKLNDVRQLKIKLPKDYNPDADIKYPVIVVFDGDYLFEPIAGQVDFQTYFDDMPPSIIVGVIQGNNRFYDGYVDALSGLPTESGLRFYNFVEQELIPFIDKNYRTSPFRVAVGHDLMGNFINAFLFKENPAFQAYVCISPDLSGTVKDYLAERLDYFNKDIFYYMATAEHDIREIRHTILDINAAIKNVENENLTYYFDDFEDEKHYTLVSGAIAKSFDKIFNIYKPIREKEIQEKVVTYEGTLDKYLIDRYSKIEDLFGITKVIEEEEIEKVLKVAEDREDLESIFKLGKLAQKLYPKSSLGSFILALHSEKSGKNKKAMKLYKTALDLEETSHITKEYIMSQVEKLSVAVDDNEDDD